MNANIENLKHGINVINAAIEADPPQPKHPKPPMQTKGAQKDVA